MKTEANTDIAELIDLDKPLVCEVVWIMPNGDRQPCGKEATHTGIGHAELEGHVDASMVVCSRCVKVVVLDIRCKICDVPLLRNVRPL